jgi:hypothetical protein
MELLTMDPNMLLLVFTPDTAGLVPDSTAKPSRLRRIYDSIVEKQTQRAERVAKRHLRDTGYTPARDRG